MQKHIRQIYQPKCGKLLGITVEQIQKDIRVLGKLHPEEHENPKKII